MTMLQREHLEWARRRAMRCVAEHDYDGAVTQLVSDLGKHDRLARLLTPGRLLPGINAAREGRSHDLCHWIESFGEDQPKPQFKSVRRQWAR